MYYVIDLQEEPRDLNKAVDSLLLPGFTNGRYLHIAKHSSEFFRAYSILPNNYELIDTQKLKEILLVKHLKD